MFLRLKLLLIPTLLLPFASSLTYADEGWTYQFSYGSTAVWSRAQSAKNSEVRAVIERSLPKIVSSEWLKSSLPIQWALLLEGKRAGGAPNLSWTHTQLADPENRPAIVLDLRSFLDPETSSTLLTHELAHIAHWRRRAHEQSWVSEGIAMSITRKITHLDHACIGDAQRNPETSLIASLDPTQPGFEMGEQADIARCAQYGHIYQFFTYLLRHCGGNTLLQSLFSSSSEKTGIAFLNEQLAGTACKNFDEIFRLFEVARFAEDYSDPTRWVLVVPKTPITIRDTRLKKLPPYSATAYRPSHGDCAPADLAIDTDRCLRLRLK